MPPECAPRRGRARGAAVRRRETACRSTRLIETSYRSWFLSVHSHPGLPGVPPLTPIAAVARQRRATPLTEFLDKVYSSTSWRGNLVASPDARPVEERTPAYLCGASEAPALTHRAERPAA